MKKVLFLGAASAQVPAIRYARDAGYYVVTADYLPENPGHRLAHEWYNVSTTDRDGILRLASDLCVDGVVAYASDPAAPTAAYACERLGLATNAFRVVNILTSKHLFRAHLREHGFPCPAFGSFSNVGELLDSRSSFRLPVVVKPVDSSGSKGVAVVREWDRIGEAFERAISFSLTKHVIVEEFVGRDAVQILGEGFIQKGKLALSCFARHRFDTRINGLVPIGGDFPYPDGALTNRLQHELQRLLDSLPLVMGPMNLEFRVEANDQVYLMEVAPRNGGNMIPQLVTRATGFDMIKNTIDVALGFDCDTPAPGRVDGFYAYYVLHSDRPGRLRRIAFSETLQSKIFESNVWARPGQAVEAFLGANLSLGVLLLSFSSAPEMTQIMDNINQHVLVDVV